MNDQRLFVRQLILQSWKTKSAGLQLKCSWLRQAPASWWGNIGTEIKIGGLRATMKLLSSIQAQVIQSLVTFQHSSGDSFPVESPPSEDRKRRNEAPEKI